MLCHRVLPLITKIRLPHRCFSQDAPVCNVDLREVDTLGKHSQEWWDPTGPLKGLHAMNALRVPLIRDGLISTGLVPKKQVHSPQVLDGLKILEVGCGGGILTEALARVRANIVGIDPGEKLIEVARNHANADKSIADRVQYFIETVEEHSAKHSEKYDAVVVSEVLEHVNDKSSFLEHCAAALRPGGSIFITTLNKTSASWLGGIVAAEYVLKLVPEGAHDWDKFISPVEVQRILKLFNCETILIHGMAYEFWRNNWVWCKNTEINYALQAVKTTAD